MNWSGWLTRRGRKGSTAATTDTPDTQVPAEPPSVGEQLAEAANSLLDSGFAPGDLAQLCSTKDHPVDAGTVQLWTTGITTGFVADVHAIRIQRIAFAIRVMTEKWGVSSASFARVFMYTQVSIGRTLADRIGDDWHSYGEAVEDLVAKGRVPAVLTAANVVAALPPEPVQPQLPFPFPEAS